MSSKERNSNIPPGYEPVEETKEIIIVVPQSNMDRRDFLRWAVASTFAATGTILEARNGWRGTKQLISMILGNPGERAKRGTVVLVEEVAAKEALEATNFLLEIQEKEEQLEIARDTGGEKVPQLQVLTQLSVVQPKVSMVTSGLVEEAGQSEADPRAVKAVEFALNQLGDTYILGGEGPNVWDCARLVYFSYKQAGVLLKGRVAGGKVVADQWRDTPGRILSKNEKRLPGDLVVFALPNGNFTHVGMMISDWRFVEATPPKVRISSINPQDSDYRRVLMTFHLGDKRILESPATGR